MFFYSFLLKTALSTYRNEFLLIKLKLKVKSVLFIKIIQEYIHKNILSFLRV